MASEILRYQAVRLTVYLGAFDLSPYCYSKKLQGNYLELHLVGVRRRLFEQLWLLFKIGRNGAFTNATREMQSKAFPLFIQGDTRMLYLDGFNIENDAIEPVVSGNYRLCLSGTLARWNNFERKW